MDSVYKLVLHQNNSKLSIFFIGIIISLFISWPICIVIALLLTWIYISGFVYANKYTSIIKNNLIAKKNTPIKVTIFEQQATTMLSGNRRVIISKNPYTIDTLTTLSDKNMAIFLYKLEYGILHTYISPLYITKTDGLHKKKRNYVHIKPEVESKTITVKFQKKYHNIEKLTIQFIDDNIISFHEESMWHIQ